MNCLIAVIGYSNSGKTTFIEALVPELKRRGYRVGTVKHAHHRPSFDKMGKDSWRHFEAGADTTLMDSAATLAMIKRKPPDQSKNADLHALSPYFGDVDVVIAEGFKAAECPKIEVYRSVDGHRPLCLTVENVIAVVADSDADFPVPRFAITQIAELAEMIETCILQKAPGNVDGAVEKTFF